MQKIAFSLFEKLKIAASGPSLIVLFAFPPGGIIAGAVSDNSGMSATTCSAMLVVAIPMLFIYEALVKSWCPMAQVWQRENDCLSLIREIKTGGKKKLAKDHE